jgi:hypothetical protein
VLQEAGVFVRRALMKAQDGEEHHLKGKAGTKKARLTSRWSQRIRPHSLDQWTITMFNWQKGNLGCETKYKPSFKECELDQCTMISSNKNHFEMHSPG